MSSKVKWISSALALAMSLASCAADELPYPERFPKLPDIDRPPTPQPTPAPTPDAPQPDVNVPSFVPSGNAELDQWRPVFAQKAANAGYSVSIIHSVLQSVEPLQILQSQAIGGDQPEFVKPIWDYVASATHPNRVATGREKLATFPTMFTQIEARYAPPREILASIWGMETSYGRILGSSDAVQQLAALAYTGQRKSFAEDQLLSVFKLIETGEVSREQLKKASWAGAFGQTQFMPSTFLAHGRDGDGDGRKDVWNSQNDALSSAANYLQASGWKKGQPWALEAKLPANVDYSLGDGTKREWRVWKALGFAAAHNRSVPDNLKAELFLPAGSHGPAFFLFDNFYVIKTYNNADSYALSIGLLADKLAGRPDLTRPWPTNIRMLTRSEVKELQAGLNKLGYNAGPVDGLAGRGTRGALQRFQKDRDLVADGFPTVNLLLRVKQEAGA